MIRIALIGAGAHASDYHFPALLDHQLHHPDSLQISAVCDKDLARATALAGGTGAAVLDSWQDALDLADAVIACVPPSLTPEVARTCARRNLPLLMEKPLASTLSEAEAVVADLAGARVMASMNRHFDPTVTLLRRHLGDHVPRLLRITQSRSQRFEPEFLPFTGIHVVDLAIFLAGAPDGAMDRHDSIHHGARWTDLHWTTAAGTRVEVAIKPTLGCNQERVEVVGEGWQGESRSAWMDDGTVRWQDEIHPFPKDWPDWKKAGTDLETTAFLAACRGEGPWEPTPASVLVATKLLGG
jgi:predicted dehydrogenase